MDTNPATLEETLRQILKVHSFRTVLFALFDAAFDSELASLDTSPSNPQEQSGREEMNLAKFPIPLLTNRVFRDENEAVYQPEIRDELADLTNASQLVVQSSNYAPGAVTNPEIVIFIQLTKLKSNFQREVDFTRTELIKLLDSMNEGENYDRLRQSLLRITNAAYNYGNAVWDSFQETWMTKQVPIDCNLNYGSSGIFSIATAFMLAGHSARRRFALDTERQTYPSVTRSTNLPQSSNRTIEPEHNVNSSINAELKNPFLVLPIEQLTWQETTNLNLVGLSMAQALVDSLNWSCTTTFNVNEHIAKSPNMHYTMHVDTSSMSGIIASIHTDDMHSLDPERQRLLSKLFSGLPNNPKEHLDAVVALQNDFRKKAAADLGPYVNRLLKENLPGSFVAKQTLASEINSAMHNLGLGITQAESELPCSIAAHQSASAQNGWLKLQTRKTPPAGVPRYSASTTKLGELKLVDAVREEGRSKQGRSLG